MLRPLLIVVCVAAGVQSQKWQTNKYWYNTNNMVQFVDSMDNMLARTVEDESDRTKATYSYMMRKILEYLVSNGTVIPPPTGDMPADVIAGDSRHYLTYLKAVLLPVTNVIKLECRPETLEAVCLDAVHSRVVKTEEKLCPGFAKSYKFHGDIVRFMETTSFPDFLHLIETIAAVGQKNIADLTLVQQFFKGTTHAAMRSTMMKLFQKFTSTDFPCAKPFFHPGPLYRRKAKTE